MKQYARLLPALAVVALVALVVRTDPQSLAQPAPNLDCPLDYCLEAQAQDPLYSPSFMSLLQQMPEDCTFQELSLPIECLSLSATYGASVWYVDPATGLPLASTYPIHSGGGVVVYGDVFAPLHDPQRPVGHALSSWLLGMAQTTTTTVGVRTDTPPTTRVYLDPTLGGSPTSTRDLGTGQTLAGVLAIQACGSPTSTVHNDDDEILDRYLTTSPRVDIPAGSTTGLVWTLSLPLSATVSMVELAVPAPGDGQQGPLVIDIIDPGDQTMPLSGVVNLTELQLPVLGTFEVTPGAPGSPASWMPALPVQGPAPLEAYTTYWLYIRDTAGWSLGGWDVAATDLAGGAGHPEGRLFRGDLYDYRWWEMPADLAFVLVGSTYSNLSAIPGNDPRRTLTVQATPTPFSNRTVVRWEGRGAGEATVEVYDLRGRRVRALRASMHDSRGEVAWDGRDEQGRRLPQGTYLVRVRTETGDFNTSKVALLH